MAKKIFNYRGKTLEELQALDLDELAELLTSAARRKLKRGFTSEEVKLHEKIVNKDNVKTHRRDMLVLPSFVGKTIHIHSGQKFEKVTILPEMIGLRFGELVLSRKRITHSSPGVGASRSGASVSVR